MGDILIGFLIIVAVFALVAYLYFYLRPVMAYLYVNTLLQSRSGKFISEKKLSELASVESLSVFVNDLTDTFFEVDGVELDDVHKAFANKYVHLLFEIKQHTPKGFGELIDTYLLLQESAMIKYLYKCKFLQYPLDMSYVHNTTILNEKMVARLEKSGDLEEFKALFSQTAYKKVLLREYANLAEFELAMDEFIEAELEQRLKRLKLPQKRKIKDLFSLLIDQHNIMLVIQSILRKEKVYLLSGGSIQKTRLTPVKKMDDLKTALAGTSFAQPLESAFSEYEKSKRVFVFEIALERFILDIGKKELLLKPQGPFSVLVYMLMAKRDKQNVQVLSKSITSQIPEKQRMEMII